jgi:GAF domain-containing protein
MPYLGPNAPIDETFCGIVALLKVPVEVVDGHTDARYPRMRQSQVRSYCGVPIRSSELEVIGALCHFDYVPRQAPTGTVERLNAAALEVYRLSRFATPS